MHGTYYANMAVHHSDVLVAVGARFDDRVTGRVDAFAPHAEIIHIDIDPSSISKNIKVDVPIVGDCRRVLSALVEAVKRGAKDDRRSARGGAGSGWREQIAEWKRTQPLRYDWSDDVIKPQYVIQEISNLTRGEAIDRHRRGPAPDVGGPVLQASSSPAALVHLGRPGHHGLRAADRHGRAGRPSRTSWSSTSTATAPSR